MVIMVGSSSIVAIGVVSGMGVEVWCVHFSSENKVVVMMIRLMRSELSGSRFMVAGMARWVLRSDGSVG